jgi:hypothetical protein
VPTRSRRFPDELLCPVQLEDVPEEARVELLFLDKELIEAQPAGRRCGSPGEWGPTVSFSRQADELQVIRGPFSWIAFRGVDEVSRLALPAPITLSLPSSLMRAVSSSIA